MDICPKDTQLYHKHTFSTMFIAAIFIIVRTWKQPRYPSTEERIKMKKMWYIYTIEYYSVVVKKNHDNMKFAGKWMELEKNHPE